MRKRFFILIALVCCLVLAAGILAACNNGESTQTGGQTPGGQTPGGQTPGGEGIEPARLIFEKTENGYSVTGYEGAPTVVVIPETYEGLPVTSIGAGAFYNCSGLTSVTIPDSVTSIGVDAFDGCSGLTSVIIPNSVTSIGEWAFGECFGLTSVIIGDGVTSIGDYAFASCIGLTSVVIPDSVTSIGEGAFSSCGGLTSVTIGEGVTSIGDYAFADCYKLIEVYNKSSLNITAGSENNGYAGCYARNVYTEEGGSRLTDTADGFSFFYDGEQGYLMGYYGSETDVTLPAFFRAYDGTFITKYAIYDYAFVYCTGLTSVTIPDSVTSIGEYAFEGCYKLVEVYNKSSLNITAGSEDNGYAGCYAKNVYTKEGGSWFTDTADGFRFFYDGEQGYLMGYYGSETDVTLPASFTAYDGTFITKYAIYGYAFVYCTGLTSVTIPDSVTSIGAGAFSYCTGLTSVTIPDSVTSIGAGAFSYCTGLTSVIIPDSVESIGASAFYGCDSLVSVYYTGDMASWCGIAGNDGFGSIMSSGRTLYIGGNKVEGEIIIPDGVTAIPSYAFAYQTGITSVIIPDSVTSIGSYAFRGCTGLTSVTIGEDVTSIGNYAFRNCSSLTSVTIGDSVTSIGESAFEGCTGLTSITIPDSVTSIGDDAFAACYGLTSIYYTGDIASWLGKSWQGNVMYSGRTLYLDGNKVEGEIIIPDGVTAIPSYAFLYQTGITSVTIPDSVTSIGEMAFRDCSSLTSVTIPDSVTSIGMGAFVYCTGLTSIIIPGSVTSIGSEAFLGCSGLTSVTIGEGVTSIGDYAFASCIGLTSVTFEGTVEEWNAIEKGTGWNHGCPFTEVVYSDGTVSVEKE